MNYGHLELRIEELLQEKGISKNTICLFHVIHSIIPFYKIFN